MKYKWQFHKEIKLAGKWFNVGFSFRRFGLGFSFDKYCANLDLFFFWFGVEF